MPQAVLLSQDSYNRIMKMLHDYEAGALKIIPGDGLKVEEVGKDGTKIGFDQTIQLNVCIDGAAVSKTFPVTN